MTNLYWQHSKSGETFAVVVDDNGGGVIQACGPLTHDEVTATNIATFEFDSDSELADSLNEHTDDYKLQTWFGDNYNA